MRRGVTLVEVLVVLALLGLVFGMSTLAAGGMRGFGSASTPDADRIRGARAEAIRKGRPVRLERDSGGPALFLPDGRAVASDLDPIAGGHTDAP